MPPYTTVHTVHLYWIVVYYTLQRVNVTLRESGLGQFMCVSKHAWLNKHGTVHISWPVFLRSYDKCLLKELDAGSCLQRGGEPSLHMLKISLVH